MTKQINKVTGGLEVQTTLRSNFSHDFPTISVNTEGNIKEKVLLQQILGEDFLGEDFVIISGAGLHPRLAPNGNYKARKENHEKSDEVAEVAFSTFISCVFPAASLILNLKHLQSTESMLNGGKGTEINIRHTENINPKDALKQNLAHMASTPLYKQQNLNSNENSNANSNANPMMALWQRKRAERQLADNDKKRSANAKRRGI